MGTRSVRAFAEDLDLEGVGRSKHYAVFIPDLPCLEIRVGMEPENSIDVFECPVFYHLRASALGDLFGRLKDKTDIVCKVSFDLHHRYSRSQ